MTPDLGIHLRMYRKEGKCGVRCSTVVFILRDLRVHSGRESRLCDRLSVRILPIGTPREVCRRASREVYKLISSVKEVQTLKESTQSSKIELKFRLALLCAFWTCFCLCHPLHNIFSVDWTQRVMNC